jgi:hypothetical protein
MIADGNLSDGANALGQVDCLVQTASAGVVG